MSKRRIPKQVKIDEKWYNVREGWAGTLELNEWMGDLKYTAKEEQAHINNLFSVYDANNNKVGEFHTDNGTCSGSVSDLELSDDFSSNNDSGSSESSGTTRENPSGCLGWIAFIFLGIVALCWKTLGGKIGLIVGAVLCIIMVIEAFLVGGDSFDIIFFIPIIVAVSGITGAIIGQIVRFIRWIIGKIRNR